MKRFVLNTVCIGLACLMLTSCNPLLPLKKRIHGDADIDHDAVITKNVPLVAEVTEVKSTPKLEEFEYVTVDGEDGSQTLTLKKYNGTSSDVIVAISRDNISVTGIGKAAFADNTALLSVVFPQTLEFVDNYAFSGCTALEALILPHSVTRLGVKAFKGCTSLTEIHIPSSVTSLGEGCFSGCTGIASASLSSTLTAIPHNAFLGCTALEYLYIPKAVTTIQSGAFKDCSELIAVDISENVTYIAPDAFEGCNAKFNCPEESYARSYALEHGFEVGAPVAQADVGSQEDTDSDSEGQAQTED